MSDQTYLYYQEIVVPLEGESLNSLFDELAEWEHQLKHSGIDLLSDLEEPSP